MDNFISIICLKTVSRIQIYGLENTHRKCSLNFEITAQKFDPTLIICLNTVSRIEIYDLENTPLIFKYLSSNSTLCQEFKYICLNTVSRIQIYDLENMCL